jgi:WD40-like Beta Propeller Repeat
MIVLSVSASGALAGAAALASTRPPEPTHAAAMTNGASPAWSPDGRRIAYIRYINHSPQ